MRLHQYLFQSFLYYFYKQLVRYAWFLSRHQLQFFVSRRTSRFAFLSYLLSYFTLSHIYLHTYIYPFHSIDALLFHFQIAIWRFSLYILLAGVLNSLLRSCNYTFFSEKFEIWSYSGLILYDECMHLYDAFHLHSKFPRVKSENYNWQE